MGDPNEMIDVLAKENLSGITEEIIEAKLNSVIVDSTIDITRIDQFSLSLRYVAAKGQSIEHFIQFEELPSSNHFIMCL